MKRKVGGAQNISRMCLVCGAENPAGLHGCFTRDTPRLFEGAGEIVLDDGVVAVEARGRYMKMPLDAITDGDFDQRDWFADPRQAPGSIEL